MTAAAKYKEVLAANQYKGTIFEVLKNLKITDPNKAIFAVGAYHTQLLARFQKDRSLGYHAVGVNPVYEINIWQVISGYCGLSNYHPFSFPLLDAIRAKLNKDKNYFKSEKNCVNYMQSVYDYTREAEKRMREEFGCELYSFRKTPL